MRWYITDTPHTDIADVDIEDVWGMVEAGDLTLRVLTCSCGCIDWEHPDGEPEDPTQMLRSDSDWFADVACAGCGTLLPTDQLPTPAV